MTFGRAVLTLVSNSIIALQQKWATYPSSWSTSTKLAALDTAVSPGPAVDVKRAEIKNVLTGHGVYANMQAYVANPGAAASQACLMATNYLLALIDYESSISDTLKASDPAILNTIETISPDLLADPANGMTPAILDAVMNLITPSIPWWKANGFTGPVLVSDLIAAGNLF